MKSPEVPKPKKPVEVIEPEEESGGETRRQVAARPQGREQFASAVRLTQKAKTRKASLLG